MSKFMEVTHLPVEDLDLLQEAGLLYGRWEPTEKPDLWTPADPWLWDERALYGEHTRWKLHKYIKLGDTDDE